MKIRLFSLFLILCLAFSFTLPIYAYSSATPYVSKSEVSVSVGGSTSVSFSYGTSASSVSLVCSNLNVEAKVIGTTVNIIGLQNGTSYITLNFNDGTSSEIYVKVGKVSSSSNYEDDEDEITIKKGSYKNIYIDLDEYDASRATVSVTRGSSYITLGKTSFTTSGYLKVTGRYNGDSTIKVKYNSGEEVYYYITVSNTSSSSNYYDDEDEIYIDEVDDTETYYIDLEDYDAEYAKITYDDDYVEVNKTYFYSSGTLKITAIDEGESEVKIKFDTGDVIYLTVYCGDDDYNSGYDEEEDLYIDKGDYETYYIDLDEYYADKATITYSSTYVSVNKTTFTSSGTLKITAKKAGESTVKIRYDSGDTVYLNIECESGSGNYGEPYVSKEDITVKKGSSSTFYVYLEDCDKATLSVNDTSVASISKTTIYNDSSITVTGKKVGDTSIRVKFDDGSSVYVDVEVTNSTTSSGTVGLNAIVDKTKIEKNDYAVLEIETNSSYSSATVTLENPSALKLDVSNYSKYTKSYSVYVGTNNTKEVDLIGLDYGEYDVTVKIGTKTFEFTIEVVEKIQSECDGVDSKGNNYLLNERISVNKSVLENGYINGYADGSFGPDLNISREEFGVMLSRILDSEKTVSSSDYISDVTASWSKDGIAELVAMGVVSKNNSYRPNDKITRAEVAEMIYNALDLNNFNDSCNLTDLYNTSLDKKIAKCCNAGIINGYPNGTFGGSNYITRAEAVTMLNRVFYKNNSTTKVNTFIDVNNTHWAYSSIVKAANR